MDNAVDMSMRKSEYENIYNSEDKMWWYLGLRDLLLFYLHKFCPAKGIVFDAGCGTGKNVEFLQSNGFDVHGVDISIDAINFCRQRKLWSIKNCSITKIPYGDNFFDAVYSLDVIGNLGQKERLEAVNEFIRVVKSGGIVIIHTAALECLRSQHDDIINLKKRFTKKELKLLFNHRQVKLLKLSYRVFLLFLPIAMVKWFKKVSKRFTKMSSTDLKMPPRPVNALLTKVQVLENRILKSCNLPIGASLFMVLKKC